jgi:hypothetical protein
MLISLFEAHRCASAHKLQSAKSISGRTEVYLPIFPAERQFSPIPFPFQGVWPQNRFSRRGDDFRKCSGHRIWQPSFDLHAESPKSAPAAARRG